MPYKISLRAGSVDFRFPEDVDWAFVDSFLEDR